MTDLTPWVGLVGVVVGAVITALLEDWRARRARGWQHDDEREVRIRDLQLRQIAQARTVLLDQLERLKGTAVGDADKIAEVDARDHPGALGFIDLLAEEDLIRDYAATLAQFYGRVGTGLAAEEVRRVTRLEIEVARALTHQEQRVIAGEPLAELSDEVLNRLFDPKKGITSPLEPRPIPPTVAGRIARVAVALRSRLRI